MARPLTGEIAYSYVTGEKKSARLRGAAYAMAAKSGLRRQRDPLTLQQLRALEMLMLRKGCTPEPCVLGHCLFVVHSCARWSDVLALEGPVTADHILIEATSKHTKTNRCMKRLRSLVPYAGLQSGVSGLDWGLHWVAARKACGLKADPSILSLGRDGLSKAAHMGSAEGARRLRSFLSEASTAAPPSQIVGSHSLKATMLAWAARYGIPSAERRHICS
eukprot:781368-Amphidinium_carterae.1